MAARDIHVRLAQPDDAEMLGTFLRTSWRDAGPDAPGFTGATDEIIAELAEPAALRAIIDSAANEMWVALDGDDIVGFAATRRIDPQQVELSGIVVARAASGRGVGTDLITQAIGAVRVEGTRRVIVRTEPHNDRAIGFYEARGFVRGALAEETVGERVIPVVELTMDLTGTEADPE